MTDLPCELESIARRIGPKHWRAIGIIRLAADKLEYQEHAMSLVAAELKNLRNQVTTLSAENDRLKTQLATFTPDRILTDEDKTAVKTEQELQNLNDDGTPKTPAA